MDGKIVAPKFSIEWLILIVLCLITQVTYSVGLSTWSMVLANKPEWLKPTVCKDSVNYGLVLMRSSSIPLRVLGNL
jgi:hypothetical protein